MTNDQASMSNGTVNGEPLFVLRVEAFAIFALSVVAYVHGDYGWKLFALLILVPDLSMFGYFFGPRIGARSYNAAHTYVGPAILVLVASIGVIPSLLPVALIWVVHIGFDRALGYGLKYPTRFGDTHLGIVNVGKKKRKGD